MLNYLDIAALLIIAISVIAAMIKGILSELLSLGSVIVGIVCAVLFYPQAADFFGFIDAPRLGLEFLGFAAIFIFFVVLGAVLSHLADRLMKALKIKWFDRLMGGAFGFLRGYLINLVIFLGLTAFPISESLIAGSFLKDYFLAGAGIIVKLAPEGLKARFVEGIESLYEDLQEESES
ncbi:MAG: CvpA family protein [Acidobacteriota bacterium]|nr:MAG: CvpA family protein [Acidobacteriota bacterium]